MRALEGTERGCRRSRKNVQNVAVNTVFRYSVLHRIVFRDLKTLCLMKRLPEKHFSRQNSLLRVCQGVLQKYDKRGDFIFEQR